MGSGPSFRDAWTTRSVTVGTDDSYCPSCKRVSGCSGSMVMCADQARVGRPVEVSMAGGGGNPGGVRAAGGGGGGAVAGAGAAGCGVEVPGCGDALAAGGFDAVVPGDAEPAAGAAPGVELGGLDPVVDDACAAAEPARGFGNADLAGGIRRRRRDAVGVADPLDGLDVERAAVPGDQPGGVQLSG